MVGTSLMLSTQNVPSLVFLVVLSLSLAWLVKRTTCREKGDAVALLTKAIDEERKAIKQMPTKVLVSRAKRLSRLSRLLQSRFDLGGPLIDLYQAKLAGQEALHSIHDDDYERVSYLRALSRCYLRRYNVMQKLHDIEEAVRLAQEAFDHTLINDPDRADSLDCLSICLGTRYSRRKDMRDIGEAIRWGEEAVKSESIGDLDRASYLHNLAEIWGFKYRATGHEACLEEATCLARKFVQLAPDSPRRAGVANLLGMNQYRKFEITKAPDDLCQTISHAREALSFVPEASFDHRLFRGKLAQYLLGRGEIADVREAKTLLTYCLENHPKHLSRRVTFAYNLCIAFLKEFEYTKTLADLENAVKYARIAVASTSSKKAFRQTTLSALGECLTTMYETTHTSRHLEEAIKWMREAVKLSPKDTRLLVIFCRQLLDYFELKGDLDELNEAIRLGGKAFPKIPNSDRNWYRIASVLSIGFYYRYDRIGAFLDLEEAIRLARLACTVDPPHAAYLDTLCQYLKCRYTRKHFRGDLDEAILVGREAVELARKHGEEEPLYYNTLHTVLQLRGMENDLDEAIQLLRRAIELVPDDDHSRSGFQYNLCSRLKARMQTTTTTMTQRAEDLVELVETARSMLRATNRDYPHMVMRLSALGDYLMLRYRMDKVKGDFREAAMLYSSALRVPNADPRKRIRAGRKAFGLYLRCRDWKLARTTAETIVQLFPQLALRWLPRDDQQHILKSLAGFSAEATATVLMDDRPPSEAFHFLEACRGIIASLTIDSRRDISRLEDADRSLYEEYNGLRKLLSTRFWIDEDDSDSDVPGQITQAVSRRVENVKKLQDLEAKIRNTIPALKEFMLPVTSDGMRELAGRGPIVAFNVSSYRSDALIITKEKIESLPLPQLSLSEVQRNANKLGGKEKLAVCLPSEKAAKQKELLEILQWLWDAGVHPVLSHLGFLSPTSSRRIPHVWWITTGHMGQMPVHAAGDSVRTTSDYVVSSYIPTLKTLQYAREKRVRYLPQKETKMLIVTMPRTAELRPLKVEKEVASIVANIQPIEHIALEEPSKGEVSDELTKCHLVHFACHAIADSGDPSAGSLFLGPSSSKTAERLTVRELADMQRVDAQIAYLSACSTAENSSDKLVDEVIHIASAFQLIGFPHVIGTLWEAHNKAATEVAEAFYKTLLDKLRTQQEHDDSHDAVAYALHEAVKRFRRKRPHDAFGWVPFIHMGA